MKRPNFLEGDKQRTETDWDSLRDVPFSGEIGSEFLTKKAIREKLTHIGKKYRSEPLSVQTFMLIVLRDLRPLLIDCRDCNICGDYDYWLEALAEIRPILVGYWAECDPMIIRYLFLVFVAQFLTLMLLWEKVGFSDIYFNECSMIGEFFMDIGAVQGNMLSDTVERWGLLDRS